MTSRSRTLFRTLMYGEQPDNINRWLNFFLFYKIKFKASNTLLNSAENTITRKECFSFLVQISCIDTATVVYPKGNHHQTVPSLQRSNSWTKSRREFFSSLFTVIFTKPDRKPYPLPCGLRNPYRNLKHENSQDYAWKPQRNCTFMNPASDDRKETLSLFPLSPFSPLWQIQSKKETEAGPPPPPPVYSVHTP
jgi:hypothetical protein